MRLASLMFNQDVQGEAFQATTHCDRNGFTAPSTTTTGSSSIFVFTAALGIEKSRDGCDYYTSGGRDRKSSAMKRLNLVRHAAMKKVLNNRLGPSRMKIPLGIQLLFTRDIYKRIHTKIAHTKRE